MACCPECTCEERAAAPMTIVAEQEPARAKAAWEMWGLALPSDTYRPPRMRQLEASDRYDWHPAELLNGVAMIEVKVAGDEPNGLSVKVIGADPVEVHDTWHRTVGALIGKTLGWFGETKDVPF